MHRKTLMRLPWLILAGAGAVAGILLRKMQLENAFEESGLATPGAPTSVMLLCGLAIIAAIFAMLTAWQPIRKDNRGRPLGADRALISPETKVFPVLLVIAAFLALVAAPIFLSQGFQLLTSAFRTKDMGETVTNNGLLVFAAGIGAVLTFIGLFQMARECNAPGRRGRSGYGGVMPAAGCCIWLMEHFRSFAPHPELWEYGPQLIAIALAMFFYLDLASLASSAPHPKRALWLGAMTVVLSALSLLQAPNFGDLALLCSQLLAAIAVLWQMPDHLNQPLPSSTRPAPREPLSNPEEIL